jgi:uncharacterized protein (TIGR02453 family)
MAVPAFNGFPRECVTFYEELKRNNSREWFAEHKAEFDQRVVVPARDFVSAMGVMLSQIAPGVVADPRPDKSIFRQYRDTRFSKDKSPYKTHLGIFFWEGNKPKMECSGFYFHLEPPELMLATGMHCFPKQLMGPYRDSVADAAHGDALLKAVAAIEKKPAYTVGGKKFKKTPRGYDPATKAAEYLLYDGLYAFITAEIPADLYSKDLVAYCLKRFKDMLPLHEWLRELVARAAAEAAV